MTYNARLFRGKTYYFDYYQTTVRNENPPLVFINGAFQSIKSWEPLVKCLPTDIPYLRIDLPGWGNADICSSDVDFNYFSDLIENLLSHLKIEKVHMVSTSYGTPIALTFASQNPDRIQHLVLTAPLLSFNSYLLNYYPDMKKLIEKGNKEELCQFLFRIGLLNVKEGAAGNIERYSLIKYCLERQISKLSKRQLLHFLHQTDRMMKYGLDEIYKLENLNVLVIAGEHDSFTTLLDCKRIATLFDRFRFETIYNADHFLLFEKPEKVTEVLLNHIASPLPSRLVQNSARA